MVVVQGDHLNRSRIATAVCVPITNNLKWVAAPGHALLPAKATGLPKDSVANPSQIIALERAVLTKRLAKLPPKSLAQVMNGIDIIRALNRADLARGSLVEIRGQGFVDAADQVFDDDLFVAGELGQAKGELSRGFAQGPVGLDGLHAFEAGDAEPSGDRGAQG